MLDVSPLAGRRKRGERTNRVRLRAWHWGFFSHNILGHEPLYVVRSADWEQKLVPRLLQPLEPPPNLVTPVVPVKEGPYQDRPLLCPFRL